MSKHHLKALVETTFSPENLEKDTYLLSKMDEKRFVALSVILRFPKVSQGMPMGNSAQENLALLRSAVLLSDKLEVSDREGVAYVRGVQAEAPKSVVVAQDVWVSLTQPATEVEERLFSIDELLAAPYDLPALSVRSRVRATAAAAPALASDAPPAKAPAARPESPSPAPKGVLGAVLNTSPAPQASDPGASVAAFPKSHAGQSQETWADRSERRRQLFARTQGYNKGLIAVHLCRGPDAGNPWGAGRGRPGTNP
eukprot:TRINITY_DN14763_c0_g1_i1.p1 TRINITY_DN14763_c0_g1~~TRINITY_DN14763_c0_g1_i1.p1  ORF type:complete len:255 (+),score=42.21 TRINITY_DN14763_c0_g1_i1:488-1252(+)